MGQKQHTSKNKNLIIDINPITNSYYEFYLYNFKNANQYKALISSSIMNKMLKIKKKTKLIDYIGENCEIAIKSSNDLMISFNLEKNKYKLELYNIEN